MALRDNLCAWYRGGSGTVWLADRPCVPRHPVPWFCVILTYSRGVVHAPLRRQASPAECQPDHVDHRPGRRVVRTPVDRSGHWLLMSVEEWMAVSSSLRKAVCRGYFSRIPVR